jgi:hypothetical protein
MLQSFLRLFIFVVVLAGLAILFFYAFIAALIITPILFLLFYFFGRKSIVSWTVVRSGGFQQQPRSQGPVIDHDPNDLPPPERQ